MDDRSEDPGTARDSFDASRLTDAGLRPDGAAAVLPSFTARTEWDAALADSLAAVVVPWAATKRWWPGAGGEETTADCLIQLETGGGGTRAGADSLVRPDTDSGGTPVEGGEGQSGQLGADGSRPTETGEALRLNPRQSHAVFILVLQTAGDRLVQVPLVLRDASAQDTGAGLASLPIGTIEYDGGPVDVLDGTACTEFWQAWAADATVLPGTSTDRGARETLLKAASTVRPMGVEQSNTSVLLLGAAKPLIAKLYRVLHEGTQPEVELPAALAGWAGIPQLRAYLELRLPGASEPSCSAVVADAVEDADDGAVALRRMANQGEDAREVAAAIGAQIAEMHNRLEAALGTAGGPTAAELATRLEQALSDAAAASGELTPELIGALERVADRITPRAVEPDQGPAAGDVTASESPVLRNPDRSARMVTDENTDSPDARPSAAQTNPGRAIRVHGDLHLGQLLRDGDGHWFVVDFEGEPLRSLKERQLPDSPARDIAGMLRSFDYAADSDALADPSWTVEAREAFLDGYAAVRPLSDEDLAVLQAYELEKALYELQYEAAFRPHWTRIPLSGLRRIAGQ